MIFLMYNMGNSGGSWFERVCNTHPQVHAWEELTRLLGNMPSFDMEETLRMNRIDEIAIEFLMKKRNEYKSVGLIKSFGNKTKEFCLQNGGNLVQMYRNPIKVVNHKMGKKKREVTLRGVIKKLETDIDMFEGHVELYSNYYKECLSRNILTLKLEDMARSLYKRTDFFKKILERVTGVVWTETQVDFVRNNVLPVNRKDYSLYGSECSIWASWSEEKRSIFNKYFDKLMPTLGYKKL